MNLSEVLYQMMEQSQQAAQLTDLKVGTVTKADPLEITISASMAPLRGPVLLLTSAVVEKKIPVLQHNHVIHDTYTGGGSCESSLLTNEIICVENGSPLPVEDGYIILNRALSVGDKVILLRVLNGQQFIVLSRVFEGG